MGRGAVRGRSKPGRPTPKPVKSAGGEAALKVCGVGAARLPGSSWAPTWPIGTQGTWEPPRAVPAARDPPGLAG